MCKHFLRLHWPTIGGLPRLIKVSPTPFFGWFGSFIFNIKYSFYQGNREQCEDSRSIAWKKCKAKRNWGMNSGHVEVVPWIETVVYASVYHINILAFRTYEWIGHAFTVKHTASWVCEAWRIHVVWIFNFWKETDKTTDHIRCLANDTFCKVHLAKRHISNHAVSKNKKYDIAVTIGRTLPHIEEQHSRRCHDYIIYKIDNTQKGPLAPK